LNPALESITNSATHDLDKTIEKLERYAEFLEVKVKEKTAQAGSKEIL
jgi:hypothetical protein